MNVTLSYWFARQERCESSFISEPGQMTLEGPFVSIFDAKIKQFTFSLKETFLTPVFTAKDRMSAIKSINKQGFMLKDNS